MDGIFSGDLSYFLVIKYLNFGSVLYVSCCCNYSLNSLKTSPMIERNLEIQYVSITNIGGATIE